MVVPLDLVLHVRVPSPRNQKEDMNVKGDTTSLSLGIFIMMKYPEVGKVKERLAHSIGDESATSLYRMFVHDILTTVKSLDIPFHIAVYPQEAGDRFRKWLGPSTKLFHQKGMDLGNLTSWNQ